MMKRSILSSIRFLILGLIVFGGCYALAITGIGQLLFSDQANGSQVMKDDKVVGSKLIGQTFDQDKYFSGRSEKVSQLSPISEEQIQLVKKRTQAELTKNPTEKAVPNDLVTASASGVDPNISLAAAEFQIPRIANERGVSKQVVHKIINKQVQKDWFSDRRYVNVLQLNLALDKLEV